MIMRTISSTMSTFEDFDDGAAREPAPCAPGALSVGWPEADVAWKQVAADVLQAGGVGESRESAICPTFSGWPGRDAHSDRVHRG